MEFVLWMKVAVVVGTRPEFLKMYPVLEALRPQVEVILIHTGQHYSPSMNQVFFEELGIQDPKYHLGVGSGPHGAQTGRMLVEIEKVLVDEEPDVVLVQGDTISVLAGALAASKLKIRVGHVEAGLRCFNMSMPEEINRRLTDHLSYFLFAPTENSRVNLMNEGIDASRVFVTGNTIVDTLRRFYTPDRDPAVLRELCLPSKGFMLLTMHRQENLACLKRLSGILSGIELVSRKHGLPIVFPIHPRAKKVLETLNHPALDRLIKVEPFGYPDFLQLEAHARLVLTDSGGIQEESCILGVPCVTLRDETERPESVDVGANIVAGVKAGDILDASSRMLNVDPSWANPFGDGNTGQIIRDILLNDLGG